MLGWVLPIVYAFLALSIVSTLTLMLLADLRLKADSPKPVEVAAETGLGSSHHGGSHD